MSLLAPAATPESSAAQRAVRPDAGAVRRALLAEWTKLRTVRSTYWTLLITVIVTIGLSALFSGLTSRSWSHLSLADQLTFDPTAVSMSGLFLGQLAIAVLGVLVMTSEFGSGMIRSTFAAIPNRPLVIGAKSAVFAVVTFVTLTITCFVSFLLGNALLSSPVPHATLSQPGVLRAVIGGGLYLTVIGLLGLGIGAILRHTAGAIALVVGLVLILPLLAQALPGDMKYDVGKYLPMNAGTAIMNVHQQVHTLTPWAGFGVLCIYAVVALVLGGYLLVRRDV